MNEKYHIGGYKYQVGAYVNASGTYKGVILVTACVGVPYNPIVEIQTPTSFLAPRAAQFEANALALELIHTGAITKFLPSQNE